MKILAFNYEYPPLGGGGGVVFKDIVEELAQRHEVCVISSHFRDLERVEKHGNLEIHRIPVVMRKALATATMPSMLSYWPASWRYGRRLLRERSFDVINSHFVVPSSPSADMLARKFHLPHVLSIHGGDIFDPSKRMSPHRLPVVRSLVKRLLSRADRVVAQSKNTAENARQYYGQTREIDLIPLGIHPTPHEPASRDALGLPEDANVIVTVGRLVERKKIDGLIRVLAALDDPADLLVIVGDGPKKEPLAALARELGVADRVRFTGFVDAKEKSQLLFAADVFASTSEHEGFGLVFLEAMDHGLPVVAYDHGGQTDFLTDGETGGVVPLGDEARFAATLRRLKEQRRWREKCAAENRCRVQRYYITSCAQQYEQVFERVIEEGCAVARVGA